MLSLVHIISSVLNPHSSWSSGPFLSGYWPLEVGQAGPRSRFTAEHAEAGRGAGASEEAQLLVGCWDCLWAACGSEPWASHGGIPCRRAQALGFSSCGSQAVGRKLRSRGA